MSPLVGWGPFLGQATSPSDWGSLKISCVSLTLNFLGNEFRSSTLSTAHYVRGTVEPCRATRPTEWNVAFSSNQERQESISVPISPTCTLLFPVPFT